MANLPWLGLKSLQGQEEHSRGLSLTGKLASSPGSLPSAAQNAAVWFEEKDPGIKFLHNRAPF